MGQAERIRSSRVGYTTVLAATFVAAAHATAGVSQVGSGILNIDNGHTYYLIAPDINAIPTLGDLQDFAVNNLGGNLATINDAAEHAFVFNTFAPLANGDGDAWMIIGLEDIDADGNFHWFSGETPEFSAWGPNEPNFIGHEPFVAYADTANSTYLSFIHGTWADFPDVTDQLAEIPIFGIVEVAPTPGTASLIGLAGLATLRRRR